MKQKHIQKGWIPMDSLVMAVIAATMTIQADGLDTSFKSYMDYTCITDTQSVQYNLQQRAWTDDEGFRRYGDEYMVAVGTPYGNVGDHIKITLDTEQIIDCIIGDSKGDVWYHDCDRGACVVEFIVDTPKLDKMVTTMGDCSYAGFEGQVVKLAKTHCQ